MIPSDPHRFPDDLQDVADLLQAHRPEATALELDGVYRKVNTRVRKGQNSMKSRFAMMAMLVTGLLMSGTGAGLAVTGLTESNNAASAQYITPTTGVTPTTNRQFSECDANQDGVVDTTEDLNGVAAGCAEQDVLPTTKTGGPKDQCDVNDDGVISPSEAAAENCGDVAGEKDSSDNPTLNPAPKPGTDDEPNTGTNPSNDREQGAQPVRQVAASGGDQLPFTGFAAIPILLGGMALLAGGLVLRRRTITE